MKIDAMWRKWSADKTQSGGTTKKPGKGKKGGRTVRPPNGTPQPNLEPPPKRPMKQSPAVARKLAQLKERHKENTPKKNIKRFRALPEHQRKNIRHRTRYVSHLEWSRYSTINNNQVARAKDLNTIHSLRNRRLEHYVNAMLHKFSEDQMGEDIFPGDEFWDEDALLRRVLSRVPIHTCRKDRELEKVILCLDTSPSCDDYAKIYADISRASAGSDLLEMYDAPNAYITRRYDPKKRRFVEFLEYEEILSQDIANWRTFNKRNIIFFGDFDGIEIVLDAVESNKVFYFCTETYDQFKYCVADHGKKHILHNNNLKFFPTIKRRQDFINTIKKIK